MADLNINLKERMKMSYKMQKYKIENGVCHLKEDVDG